MDDQRGEGGGRSGVSRRGFLSTLVGSALSAAVAGARAASTLAGSAPPADADGLMKIGLRVNGRLHRMAVEPRALLLDLLRNDLGLAGTKLGCGRGECGACTVLVDGVPRYACMTLALEAEGHEITTVEGVLVGEELGPVQRAFVETDGFQCGYCTPGQVMAAEGLLRKTPNPTPRQVREALAGNLCRCGAYAHIFAAVQRAAELRRGGGA